MHGLRGHSVRRASASAPRSCTNADCGAVARAARLDRPRRGTSRDVSGSPAPRDSSDNPARRWGPVWSAAIVAVADLVLAVIIVLPGRSIHPGPEIELAFDVRKMAVEAIRADSENLKDTVGSFNQQISQTRDAIAGFIQNPVNTAAEHLLVPAALSILRGLRAKKEKG